MQNIKILSSKNGLKMGDWGDCNDFSGYFLGFSGIFQFFYGQFASIIVTKSLTIYLRIKKSITVREVQNTPINLNHQK